MKFVHITFRFEYMDRVDQILEDHGVVNYVRHPTVQGKGIDGKHYGSKVFPGNFTVVQTVVPDDKVERLLADLEAFGKEKAAHHHLRAYVLPVESMIGAEY